jgi:hypothetical protein
MPDDETKQALLDALENDIDEFIRLAETQPTLREPDTAQPFGVQISGLTADGDVLPPCR